MRGGGLSRFVVKSVAIAGKGGLKEEFEKLKARLSKEGLFDASHKKPVPALAGKIAVVTAATGAALRDFVRVFDRRSLFMDVLVVDSPVQGDRAAAGLRAALTRAIRYSMEVAPLDAIVLTRGGGSLEDLWAFNDEGLAWDIHACPVPVVSAVGHQVDYSITDFVSDLRCETPTAAAEYLSQRQTTIKMSLDRAAGVFRSLPVRLMSQAREGLGRRTPALLARYLGDRLAVHVRRLERLDPRPRAREFLDPREAHFRLDEAALRLKGRASSAFDEARGRIERAGALLTGLDPAGVLSRGFSYVTDEKGHVVPSAENLRAYDSGTRLSLTFQDGTEEVKKI